MPQQFCIYMFLYEVGSCIPGVKLRKEEAYFLQRRRVIIIGISLITCFGVAILYDTNENVPSPQSGLFTPGTSKKRTINPSIDIDVKKVNRRNDIDFRILVITYNRPASLIRLLDSLNAADYMNDSVCVEIWIDMSKKGAIHEGTYSAASTFHFQKGEMQVINHTRHVGIYGQWMGTWQPSMHSHEIAVILEDDLTVSPFFYRYLKHAHHKYDTHEQVNGYSMQCSMKHGGEGGHLQAPDDNLVFSYSIIGTWGFSPKRSSWLRFTNWYKSMYMNKEFRPFVPGILPTSWYKTFMKLGKTDTMWEMWHIYYAWINHEITIYPNLPHCDGFTMSWREIGLHYKVKSKITDRLAVKWDNGFERLPEQPIHLSVNGRVLSQTDSVGLSRRKINRMH